MQRTILVSDPDLGSDDEREQHKANAPVRMLFCAMLERAIRDLEHGNFNETVSAITWVRYPKKCRAGYCCLSYELICETLEISDHRKAKIAECCDNAEVRRDDLAVLSRKEEIEKRKGTRTPADNDRHPLLKKKCPTRRTPAPDGERRGRKKHFAIPLGKKKAA